MARDLGSIDPDKANDVTQNAYYKKLQQSLKDRTTTQGSDQRRHQEQTTTTDSERVTQVAKTLPVEDKVQLSSTVWKKNKSGEDELHTDSAKPPLMSSLNLKEDGITILRSLGHKIDFESRSTQLKQSFMNSVVQARSHNYFLSKYAQFKVGVFGQLLSMLGVTQEEISQLQRKALADGAKENESLMSENIYNLELTELLYGNSKKVKKSLKMYQEVTRQLSIQMTALGKPNYWNKAKLLEERVKQCKRIKDEFEREKEQLNYQLEYFRQEI